MPHVRLSARSHNPADAFVPRLGLQIPTGDGHIVAELCETDIRVLEADPGITIEPTEAPVDPKDMRIAELEAQLALQAELLAQRDAKIDCLTVGNQRAARAAKG